MQSQLRVVSLLPSATEILALIGGSVLLVGRSHECDFPAAVKSAPVLTSSRLVSETSKQIDTEVILRCTVPGLFISLQCEGQGGVGKWSWIVQSGRRPLGFTQTGRGFDPGSLFGVLRECRHRSKGHIQAESTARDSQSEPEFPARRVIKYCASEDPTRLRIPKR